MRINFLYQNYSDTFSVYKTNYIKFSIIRIKFKNYKLFE